MNATKQAKLLTKNLDGVYFCDLLLEMLGFCIVVVALNKFKILFLVEKSG